MRRAYHGVLLDMVRARRFPEEYKEWVAMLAMRRADEDPNDISRRRDLWMVCHGQKFIMRMLNAEYANAERIAARHVYRKG